MKIFHTDKNTYNVKVIKEGILDIYNKQGQYCCSCTHKGLKDVISIFKRDDKILKAEEELKKLNLKSDNWMEDLKNELQ